MFSASEMMVDAAARQPTSVWVPLLPGIEKGQQVITVAYVGQ